MLGEASEAPVVDDVEARRRRNGRVERPDFLLPSVGRFKELTNGSAGEETGCKLFP